jgi:hypothetical protein
LGEILEDGRRVEADEETHVSILEYLKFQFLTLGWILTVCIWCIELTITRREYYERTNSLLQQYIYIDRLLNSSQAAARPADQVALAYKTLRYHQQLQRSLVHQTPRLQILPKVTAPELFLRRSSGHLGKFTRSRTNRHPFFKKPSRILKMKMVPSLKFLN